VKNATQSDLIVHIAYKKGAMGVKFYSMKPFPSFRCITCSFLDALFFYSEGVLEGDIGIMV